MYQFRKRQGQSKSKMIRLALLFPMVTSMSIDIRFAQCTSRDMKLQESQTAGMTFLGCASLCKGRDSCEEFQFIDGLCTLGDNSLPESLLRTVTEGCYYGKSIELKIGCIAQADLACIRAELSHFFNRVSQLSLRDYSNGFAAGVVLSTSFPI